MKRLAIVCALLAAASSIRPQSAPQPQRPSNKSWVVEGDVADDSGPVSGVSIYATGVGRLTALTDIKGHFILTGTAPALYRIFPAKDGYEGNEGGDVQNARSVNLVAGARVTGLDFVIHKAASISGRILDPDRNPVRGAAVVLYVKHFGQHRPYLETIGGAVSEASGGYRITGIRGGQQYYLSVAPSWRDNQAGRLNAHQEPQTALVQTFYPNTTSVDNAAPIYLDRAEQREGVDLIMDQTVTYCATAMPRFELGNLPVTTGWRISYVDGGAFAMGNPKPGEELQVCGLPPGSYSLWIDTAKGDKVVGFISQTFTITNRDVALGELYPDTPRPLLGKIIVADAPADSPVPVLSIHVESLNRRQLHFFGEGAFGGSNRKGEFSIPDLYADDYGLVAVGHLPPGFYVKALTQAGRDVTRESIRPGDDLTITLLSDGPVVSGKAVDKDNGPVHDATVILIPKDQWNSSIVSARADQDGKFQLQSGIAPGEYSIVALTGVFEAEEQNSEFLSDQATRSTTLTLDKKETKVVTVIVRAAH